MIFRECCALHRFNWQACLSLVRVHDDLVVVDFLLILYCIETDCAREKVVECGCAIYTLHWGWMIVCTADWDFCLFCLVLLLCILFLMMIKWSPAVQE
jgi:hypothetical protein